MSSALYQWGIIFDRHTQKRVKCHRPVQTDAAHRLTGRFEQVACGINFTLVLHSTHRVLVVGDEPKYGRLGLGDERTIAPSLTFIGGDVPPIGSISCGPATSVLISCDQHELWAFGKGIGPLAKQIYRTDETLSGGACSETSVVIVVGARRLEERRFNRHGFVTEWTRAYELPDGTDTIRQLDVSTSLSGLVSARGHVFLWGSAVPQRRTSDDEQFVSVAITDPMSRDLPATADDRPVQISCSRGQFHSHVLLLTERGAVFALGSNYKAKLGFDRRVTFTGQWTPIDMTLTCPFRALAVGGIHSSGLAADGRVFTWGCGSDGRLGHADGEGHRYLYKESEPRPIETLVGQHVTDIGSSYYHMAAIVGQ
jgi:alpha-tubulin suppressor-like RCC1 family protein